MDKQAYEGLFRVIMAVIVGSLLGGWRGAIAAPGILFLATELLRDYIAALATIHRSSKKG